MEYLLSQSSASHGSLSSADAQQQQQQEGVSAGGGVDVAVKLTVQRLLSRLGLSELTSVIDDESVISHQESIDCAVEVHVIQSTDAELRQVGQSLALLLQLLRRCTNWNELLSVDSSLPDALARLTEHQFSSGTMRYGVHTENTVQRLASMLTLTDSCRTAAQLTSQSSADLTSELTRANELQTDTQS